MPCRPKGRTDGHKRDFSPGRQGARSAATAFQSAVRFMSESRTDSTDPTSSGFGSSGSNPAPYSKVTAGRAAAYRQLTEMTCSLRAYRSMLTSINSDKGKENADPKTNRRPLRLPDRR